MSKGISEKELSELFMETGMRHHDAYHESDGVDPEWPLFYAGCLQTRIWDRLGKIPTRSALIHFLVDTDREFQATGQAQEQWPAFYAKRFLESSVAS